MTRDPSAALPAALPAPRDGAEPPAQRRAEIDSEMMHALALQVPVGVMGNNCVAAFLLWSMWRDGPHLPIAVWAAVFAAVQLLQYRLYRAYRAEGPGRLERTRHWTRVNLCLVAAISITWACVPYVFVTEGRSLLTTLPIVLAVYTLGAGGVPILLYHLPSLAVYIAVVHLALAGKLFASGTPDEAVLGTATLLYMGAMLAFGRTQARLVRGHIRARFERSDLVEELRRQKDAAERANRAKSQFFAAASHDLRQPLHALGLFSASLRDLSEEPERRAVVDQVHASIDALESLFDELLDISKIDAGAVQAKPVHLALDAVLESMRAQFAGPAARKGLALRVVRSRAVVRTDPVLLGRILANLVSNAIRYTESGTVLLGCRSRGAVVRVEVWDSGVGIARDQHERIFEEFYQLHNAERDRRQGLGLGLATVKRLAVLLELGLTLDSWEGRGTVFRVDVPRGERARIALAPPAAAAPVDVLVGKRIVVVDDEPDIRQGMHQLLLRWGSVPLTAASGAQALGLLAHDAPDLIICDHRLAGQESGTHVIDAIRARHGAAIPAILVTGDTAPHGLRPAQPGHHVLQHKPVRPVQLRAACNHLLTRGLTDAG